MKVEDKICNLRDISASPLSDSPGDVMSQAPAERLVGRLLPSTLTQPRDRADEETHVKRYSTFALCFVLATAAPPSSADAPGVFHIEPVRSVADLLPIALGSTPPREQGEFRPTDLVELATLDPTLRYPLRDQP